MLVRAVIRRVRSVAAVQRSRRSGQESPGGGGWGAARWTGLSGLTMCVLLVPAIALETVGPDSSTSPKLVASDFAAARDSVLVSGALFLVAMGVGLVFVSGVTSLAHRQPEAPLARVASASGLLGIAVFSTYAASFAAIAASIGELREHQTLTYAVFRVSSAIDDGSGLFIAIFVASIAYPLVRMGLGSPWVARLGVVAALVRAVGVLDITTLGAWPFGPFMVVGTLLCVLWLLLTSLSLLHAGTARLPDLGRPIPET